MVLKIIILLVILKIAFALPEPDINVDVRQLVNVVYGHDIELFDVENHDDGQSCHTQGSKCSYDGGFCVGMFDPCNGTTSRRKDYCGGPCCKCCFPFPGSQCLTLDGCSNAGGTCQPWYVGCDGFYLDRNNCNGKECFCCVPPRCKWVGGDCRDPKDYCDLANYRWLNGSTYCKKGESCCAPLPRCSWYGGMCQPSRPPCGKNQTEKTDRVREYYCVGSNGKQKCCVPNPLFHVKLDPHGTGYSADIENAIGVLLNIILKKATGYSRLNSTVQGNLTNFLQVMVDYTPLRTNVSTFLTNLLQFINQNEDITAYELLEQYNCLDNNNEGSRMPRARAGWLGCQGSQPRYRGFTCGMWTIFHAMSVSLPNNSKPMEARRILPAIRDLQEYFEWCSVCKDHFIEMYDNHNGAGQNTADDVVLWLWKAHNKVNCRIKDKYNQDPAYPKIEFPSIELCPYCYESGRFAHDKVLSHLRSIYGKDRLTKYESKYYPGCCRGDNDEDCPWDE